VLHPRSEGGFPSPQDEGLAHRGAPVLIVNVNLTVDRTIALSELRPGYVQRTGAARTTLGGKGVNVARVVRAHGHDPVLFGFLPKRDAGRLARLAGVEGADLHGIEISGEVRVASVLLESSGRVTVLNEPGPTVGEDDWESLVAALADLLPGHRLIACSGSVPPGSPPDAYGRVVAAARRAGVTSIVDSSGVALAGAVVAGADVVCPNLSEAESLLYGNRAEEIDPSGAELVGRAATAVSGLLARGAHQAVVSAGSHGAAFSLNDGVAWCPAPAVTVVNPVGAGDSLVGGLLHSLEKGWAWVDAVRYAVVVASASCEQPLAGGVDLARVTTLLAELPPITGATPLYQPSHQLGRPIPGLLCATNEEGSVNQ